MERQKEMDRLREWIGQSQRIVFFGGAGVSTESGIPDFRSVDGLYSQSYDVPPETMVSHGYFQRNPVEFYRFYREKMLRPALAAQPNAAHRKLAELEQAGKLLAVITQNIDGLHQAAGSRTVYELHGSVHRNRCLSCGAMYDPEYILSHTPVPRCAGCGGLVKPEVVLYEEQLDGAVLSASLRALHQADMVIVGGTSLSVYPAAGLLDAFTGARLVLINQSPTPLDKRAGCLIADRIGEVLSQISCGYPAN